MANAVSATVDVSGLAAVIPALVEFGRRTTAEQCVTSMGMILQEAQDLTPYSTIGQIDSDLQVEGYGVTKGGKLSKAKKPRRKEYRVVGMKGVRIVLSRMYQDSEFNLETGQRWFLPKPQTHGAAAFWDWVWQALQRMTKSRHSSAHFMQAGYAAARNACVQSPLFKNKYRAAAGAVNANPMDIRDKERLGGTEISGVASAAFLIRSENNVGTLSGQGTMELSAKHRQALLDYSLPAVEAAVAHEMATCQAELQRRLLEGWPIFNARLA